MTYMRSSAVATFLLLVLASNSKADDRSTCHAAVDHKATIAACTRIIDARQLPRGADLSVIYNQRGLSFEKSGSHEQAIADLNEAVRLNPNNAIAFSNRSWVHNNAGNYDLAVADATEAIRLNRKYVTAYVNRGTAHEKKDEFERAVADYSEAIKLNPKFAPALNNRGVCYDKLGRYDDAIRDFDAAIRLSPRESATYFNRAVTYEKKGDLKNALANFRVAAKLDGKDPSASAAITQLEEKLKNSTGADLAVATATTPASENLVPKQSPPIDVGRRVALVIGNGAYRSVPQLANPTRDATSIAELFRSVGFAVVQQRQNLDAADLRRAIREFSEVASDADVAIVYFAGHGIEVGGTNYLIPIDARLERDIDVEDESLSLDRVLQLLEPTKRLRLVILDACRDNRFAASMKRMSATRSVGRGLARVEPVVSDTLVAFAARAGSTAADGQGLHSPYTTALLKHLATPGLDLRLALGRVRDDVLADTKRRQEPFVYGSLGGAEVLLVPPHSNRSQ